MAEFYTYPLQELKQNVEKLIGYPKLSPVILLTLPPLPMCCSKTSLIHSTITITPNDTLEATLVVLLLFTSRKINTRLHRSSTPLFSMKCPSPPPQIVKSLHSYPRTDDHHGHLQHGYHDHLLHGYHDHGPFPHGQDLCHYVSHGTGTETWLSDRG